MVIENEKVTVCVMETVIHAVFFTEVLRGMQDEKKKSLYWVIRDNVFVLSDGMWSGKNSYG